MPTYEYPEVKEIDLSKTEGDKRDREAAAIAATLDEGHSDSHDDVFCKDRVVKEETDTEGFGESRKVEVKKEENEEPTSVSESDLYSDEEDSKKGLRVRPRNQLLSEEGIRAHQTCKFLDNRLKVQEEARRLMLGLESEERVVASEGAESDLNVKREPQYESEPASMGVVTFKEYVRFPGDDENVSDMETDEDGRKFRIRTVKLNDEQFAEFMLQDKLQRKKIQKKLRRRSLVKRLKRQNKDLMRQVRKESTRRKLLSSESDSEDPDKTMEVQHQVNNNDETNSEKDDVFQDFDRFLKEGSSQETKPVVKTPAWLEDAKNLDAQERAALLERITKELEECVGGNVKRIPMLMILITLSELFRETQHRRTILSDTPGPKGLSRRLQKDSILSKGLPRILEINSEKVENQGKERFTGQIRF